MTTPQGDRPVDETDEAAGNTGALAAASRDGSDTDPLAPLSAVTEDDDEQPDGLGAARARAAGRVRA